MSIVVELLLLKSVPDNFNRCLQWDKCTPVSKQGGDSIFGLGIPELILIIIVALVIFGPKKLPEMGRALGRSLSEFKKATSEISSSVTEQTNLNK